MPRRKKKPVYRDGQIHVTSKMCDTCIFHPGDRMGLGPGRCEELTAKALAKDSCIPCHKTTYGQSNQGEAICRGFFEKHKKDVFPLRLGLMVGNIKYQELDKDNNDGRVTK